MVLAKKRLEGSDVKVCTVIGFPLGQNTTDTKVSETVDAYENGCEEFDMVINVGKLKDGDLDAFTPEQIQKMKDTCAAKKAEIEKLYRLSQDLSK